MENIIREYDKGDKTRKIITIEGAVVATGMTDSAEAFDRRPSERVVEVVSDAKGVDPDELSPLYNVIDPDALNTLFDPRTTSHQAAAQVEFSYEGYTVIVTSDGQVDISSGKG